MLACWVVALLDGHRGGRRGTYHAFQAQARHFRLSRSTRRARSSLWLPFSAMAPHTAPTAIRFREAIPTASLSHLQRLAAKLVDLRNADSSSRKTSIVEAAEAGRLVSRDVVWTEYTRELT